MKELTKKCIIVHENGIIQIKETNFSDRCTPGNGFEFAEFDTVEELEKYISENNLITQEEAIATKTAMLGGENVSIKQYMFDDEVVILDK